MNPWGLLILALAAALLVMAVKDSGGTLLDALHK